MKHITTIRKAVTTMAKQLYKLGYTLFIGNKLFYIEWELKDLPAEERKVKQEEKETAVRNDS